MASVSNDPGGTRRIQFIDSVGVRRTIRLGKVSAKAAESIRVHIEELSSAKASGQPVSRTTALWVADLGEPLRGRLVKVGLIEDTQRVETPTIAEWTARYIEGRSDLAPRTILRLRNAAALLVQHFGSDRRIDRITAHDASCWRVWLAQERIESTVGRLTGHARQLFLAAVRAELIQRDPFAGLSAATRADRSRSVFVPREAVARLMEAAPDAEWRAILALARYAGLRVPSEARAIRWQDINWAESRMSVSNIKTGKKTGQQFRTCPMFPELRPALVEGFEQAPEGAVYVVERHRRDNLRVGLERIASRAGVPLWPKPWTNMRATRATELADQYPSHVCAAWLGHTQEIADAHYRMVHESHFQRAIQAAQNPAQQAAELACIERNRQESENPQVFLLPGDASPCYNLPVSPEVSPGVVLSDLSSLKPALLTEGGAEGGALCQILAILDLLTPDERAALLAHLQAGSA